MTAQEIQGDLFQGKGIDEDQVKEFLKIIFRGCERVWSGKVVGQAYREWEFEKEIEEEFERKAQSDDDF
jgi:hypothetical protein